MPGPRTLVSPTYRTNDPVFVIWVVGILFEFAAGFGRAMTDRDGLR
jgi:hypothetical protein